MLELTKVFNFSIKKINNKYKTIYILCDKSHTTLENVITNFKKVGIPTSPDVISILNNIFTKNIKETMFDIDGKYNIIISLFTNHLINAGSTYLINSMITNNIRNINFLLITKDINKYYKLTESMLINIYNLNNDIQNPNFFINYLNKDLQKQTIQNIIYITKCIFICKARKFKSLAELSLEPKISLLGIKNKYLHYKGNPNSNKTINIIGCVNTIYSIITMFSLLKKKINVKCYLTKPESSKNTTIIINNSNTKFNSSNTNTNNTKHNTTNLISYSNNISTKLINMLLDESINTSIPIRFKKLNNKNNTITISLYNKCSAIRLLSVL